ncbi:hypothetical protein STW0522KLE39_P20060 (plasmid) [Klebsiella quasipneumoniae]|nr:hypothetical protein STW0522KLE39_P20060 [Klebsiella quasipneumoniae]
MTKQQKTALNMAKFIQNQSLLLLEKLNELDLDVDRISLCSCWRSLTSLISMSRPTFVRNSTMMRSIFSVHCPRDWMNYRMAIDGQSVY